MTNEKLSCSPPHTDRKDLMESQKVNILIHLLNYQFLVSKQCNMKTKVFDDPFTTFMEGIVIKLSFSQM